MDAAFTPVEGQATKNSAAQMALRRLSSYLLKNM